MDDIDVNCSKYNNKVVNASTDLTTLDDDILWDIVSNIDNIEDVSVLHAQHDAATVLIIFGNHGNTHRRISELKEAMNFFGLSVVDYTTNGDNVIELKINYLNNGQSKLISSATNTCNISAKPVISSKPYPLSDGLTICPNCNEKQFNDKTGLCLACGYDEKVWGLAHITIMNTMTTTMIMTMIINQKIMICLMNNNILFNMR